MSAKSAVGIAGSLFETAAIRGAAEDQSRASKRQAALVLARAGEERTVRLQGAERRRSSNLATLGAAGVEATGAGLGGVVQDLFDTIEENERILSGAQTTARAIVKQARKREKALKFGALVGLGSGLAKTAIEDEDLQKFGGQARRSILGSLRPVIGPLVGGSVV